MIEIKNSRLIGKFFSTLIISLKDISIIQKLELLPIIWMISMSGRGMLSHASGNLRDCLRKIHTLRFSSCILIRDGIRSRIVIMSIVAAFIMELSVLLQILRIMKRKLILKLPCNSFMQIIQKTISIIRKKRILKFSLIINYSNSFKICAKKIIKKFKKTII